MIFQIQLIQRQCADIQVIVSRTGLDQANYEIVEIRVQADLDEVIDRERM